MTENRKRVAVHVTAQQRTVTIRSPAQITGATVKVEVLPVRVVKNWYEGDYEVDPRFVEQRLETENKTMKEDLTVNSILVSTTENLSGGNTVYIGME